MVLYNQYFEKEIIEKVKSFFSEVKEKMDKSFLVTIEEKQIEAISKRVPELEDFCISHAEELYEKELRLFLSALDTTLASLEFFKDDDVKLVFKAIGIPNVNCIFTNFYEEKKAQENNEKCENEEDSNSKIEIIKKNIISYAINRSLEFGKYTVDTELKQAIKRLNMELDKGSDLFIILDFENKVNKLLDEYIGPFLKWCEENFEKIQKEKDWLEYLFESLQGVKESYDARNHMYDAAIKILNTISKHFEDIDE